MISSYSNQAQTIQYLQITYPLCDSVSFLLNRNSCRSVYATGMPSEPTRQRKARTFTAKNSLSVLMEPAEVSKCLYCVNYSGPRGTFLFPRSSVMFLLLFYFIRDFLNLSPEVRPAGWRDDEPCSLTHLVCVSHIPARRPFRVGVPAAASTQVALEDQAEASRLCCSSSQAWCRSVRSPGTTTAASGVWEPG